MASVSIGNPQSNNLYAYVQNNPVDFLDPSGLDDDEVIPPMVTVTVNIAPDSNLYDTLLSLIFGGFDRYLAQPVVDGGEVVGSVDLGGGGGGDGGGGTNDKDIVRKNLDDFLKKKPQTCSDILTALGLSDKDILNAFDKNKFLTGGSSSNSAKTETPYTFKKDSKNREKPGTRINGQTTTKSKNGVIDFVNSIGFLIHEVSHAATRLTDLEIYDKLSREQKKGKISGLPDLPNNRKGRPIRTKNTASSALSDLFNNNCK